MTDEQFNAILAGSQVATREGLYRLAGLLTATLGVLQDPNDKSKQRSLADYATKVAADLVRHDASQPKEGES